MKQITVTLPDGQKTELMQTDANIPQTAKVAPKATPDKPDETLKSFLEGWEAGKTHDPRRQMESQT